MISSGLSELLIIGALTPFLAVIINPENILNYKITLFISKVFQVRQSENLALPIIIFFMFCIILSTFLRLLDIWITCHYSALIGSDLSEKVYSNNLYQPYQYHINNNSSEFITIASKSIKGTTNAIKSYLTFISNFILSTFLFSAIILINGKLAIYSLISFVSIYLIIGKKLNRTIGNNSKIVFDSTQKIIKTVKEELGSIRNILLGGNQIFFINRYKKLYLKLSKKMAENLFYGDFPRYAIEGFALLLIALASISTISKNSSNSSNSLIVILGGFVVGLQRLLPSIQRIYGSWTAIRGSAEDVRKTIKMLELKDCNLRYQKIKPLNFKKSIRFDSVNFSYLKSNKPVISNLNFEIKKGQKIGFIGKTGSGKSTTIDLIMGLLKPTNGKIYVDDIDIYDEKFPKIIHKWRLSMTHVPQNIFLTDNTIAENIAFGIEKKNISIKLVKEAAKKAQINEFIESKTNGYNTIVGEGGIKLSGGQRQRIGIARALFNITDILILDEATSALDNITEKKLINSISTLDKNLTIISIAHRHSTLKDCDRIFKFENGKIIEINSFKNSSN